MIDVGHIIAMHGYAWETKDFYNSVARLWVENFKEKFFTVEVLLCHPDAAKEFARMVRKETVLPTLEDSTILVCLLNLRKQKFLKVMEERLKKNS